MITSEEFAFGVDFERVTYVKTENAKESSPLAGILAPEKLALLGHSQGGLEWIIFTLLISSIKAMLLIVRLHERQSSLT